MSFIHLGLHSEFSIVDSIVRIPDLIKAAASDQMPALALTDLSNLYAAVKFYNACLGKGIKPILGSEIRLCDEKGRATLLAMNNDGWRNLTEIVSMGFTDGLTLGIPCIERDWIFKKNNNLIALLGMHSDVGQALRSSSPSKAEDLLEEWISQFADRVYLAISRTNRPGEDEFIELALQLAEKYQIGVVAHNDVRFMRSSDFEAHEARVCIASGYVLGDERRPRDYSDAQYFKTQAEMQSLFSDLPSVIENTVEIARRCTVSLTLGKNYLPNFPIPAEHTIESFFAEQCQLGLEERLQLLYPPACDERQPDNWPNIKQQYVDRLEFEIKTILDMGFPGYFLIVMDFIKWAKGNGVPVGPGRGSGAGSLVAYSLKITDLDPLRYELLFERFLNPERVSMPDFDVDFCIAGRDRVIDYVAGKYGREAVSQIITFGTMAAKAALRDVARVQGKSYGLADRLSKLIPTKPLGIDLKQALDMEPQLKDLVTNPANSDYDDASEIWEMALKLEGITRNVGKHAGGVLIAPNKITDFSAVYCDEEGSRVSQFDKDDVEAIGLVKFDFLGLRNLTVIEDAIKNINVRRQQQQQSALNLSTLPLDDKLAYQVFAKANTTAVFQFESPGMKRMLKEAKPSQFEEIIAFVSLYRPGPMDLIPDFIHRMHGGEFEYLHPLLENVLKPTYGIMVYQEQVMQAAQVCAGYSLGGADLLRRAMGKKKPEEMAKQRLTFIEGAAKRDIDERKANEIFDYIEKFAGYGFNKSHAAAYALVAYHTAWLKAHYTAEFMSAVLSSEMQNTDNIVFLIDDCRSNGLEVLPPSVNLSNYKFRAADDKTIIYGLGAIKGVGEAAMESVIIAREQDGEYKDLFDFCHRIDLKKTNKRTLEALIRAGAMDCFGEERSSLMEQLPDAVQAAEQARQNREIGIMDLFGEVETTIQRPQAPPVKPWSDEVRLKGEKDTLGLYLTGHPMDVYRQELKNFIPGSLSQLSATRRGSTTVFAGLVLDVANFPNRTVITLDDGTARLEVNTNFERLQRYKELIKVDQIVVIEGEVTERENFDRPFGRLNKAFSLNEIRSKRALSIVLQPEQHLLEQKDFAVELARLIQPFTELQDEASKRIPVHIHVESAYAQGTLELPEQWQVRPEDELLRTLRELLGKQAIFINYQSKSKALKAQTPATPAHQSTPTMESHIAANAPVDEAAFS
ncbi:DNA polymerase III subunit alpha [Alkanindiges sp. WGS2144]|uniref:DNA polymerase III subunit alpha n=1 Tax=Alkanindiges sp. WGS2144 TaxID=3366808 RepID=UPI003752F5C5